MDSSARQHERWLPVVGLEGLYEVSNLGRVRSLDTVVSRKSRWGVNSPFKKTGKMLSPRMRSKGYLAVSIKRKDVSVHHMVLSAFVGPRPVGYVCNHKNGIKTDNIASNLEWATVGENNKHARESGLTSTNKGQRWSHLTREKVIEIRNLSSMGMSAKKIAKMFNIGPSAALRAIKRITFKGI